MPTALQVALFSACVAVVLFVSWLIPLSLLLFRHVRSAAMQMEEVKTDLKLLIQELRAMVQNISLLSTRANHQLDELEKVVHVVRGWSERANHAVEEVSSAVEAPVLKLVRGIKKLRQIWRFILGEFGEDAGQKDRKSWDGSQPEESSAALSKNIPEKADK